MRARARRVIAHLRQQWMGALALFLVLSGGVAYAADTIGSSDIVDESILSQDIRNNEVKNNDLGPNAVQTGKIADNQVFSEDVRDDNLSGGGLSAADLSLSSVGSLEVQTDSLTNDDLKAGSVTTSELKGATIFDARDKALQDPVGGSFSTTALLDLITHQIVGQCLQGPTGTFTATVLVEGIQNGPETAVDSTAPNGVNNVSGLPAFSRATLAKAGPTTFPTWQSGQYAVASFESGVDRAGFSGNVAVATLLNGGCRFQVTAHGGGAAAD